MQQHYVPRFYLKYFIDEGTPQSAWLWEGDLETGRISTQSPKRVARLEDYYSFTDAEGIKRDDIETFLHRLETESAPILSKLCGEDFNLATEEQ